MCEFTVLLDDGNGKKQIAKNVVKAKVKEGEVVLLSSEGTVIKAPRAVITLVDTTMAEMVLTAKP